MKEQNRVLGVLVALTAAIALPGCELVEGVFKAGMWTALVLIGIVVAALFAVTRISRGRSTRTSIL